MKKRIFIAVGSESIKGVQALIKRLCGENLFKRFDDIYLAIDSDASKIHAFNNLGMRLQTSRIKGFPLRLQEADEVTKTVFQHGWTAREIPADGVGGDRTISGKALTQFRSLWFDAGMGLNTNLGREDEIFVIGSAFGGTSGGLFLSVCEFLDQQIRVKRHADAAFNNVKINGFLLMPEAAATEGNYPVGVNMIDMFRDLQTASWRRRLESERVGFKVPVLGHFNGREFQLFNQVEPGAHLLMDYGVQGSSLPMSNLYLIPTPQGKRQYHTSILAESLFVAAYIDVDHRFVKLVDRQVQGTLGPRDNIGIEDPCICGFNMFAMKSGRLVSLKNWFWHSLMKAIKGPNGHKGLLSVSDDDDKSEICGLIEEVFRKLQTPEHETPYVGVDLLTCSPLKTLLEKEKAALRSPRALNDFVPVLKGYLESLCAMAPSYRAVPAKELIVSLSSSSLSGWNQDMNCGMIKEGYKKLFSQMMQEKANRGRYAQEIVDALNKALRYVKSRQKSRVVRNWAFGLSQEEAIFQEIARAFDDKFQKVLRKYLYACRCDKTALLDVEGFAREVDTYRDECHRWYELLKQKCEELQGSGNPYVVEGKLIDLKPLPESKDKQLDFSPLRTLMCIVYRSCVTNQTANEQTAKSMAVLGDKGSPLADLVNTAENLLANEEESVINRYLEVAEDLLPGVNPLTEATLVNFADAKLTSTGCHAFSDLMRVSDSGERHYHFVVKQGEIPADFHLTNDDVHNEPLGLKTMPGTENFAAEFLSCDHSGTTDATVWKSETTTYSPMFEGLQNPDRPTRVHGLWLGTLGIDFAVRDTLDKLYSFAANVKLNMVRAGLASPRPRRLMTLVEMVRFGVVMEAIEAALKEAWKAHKTKVGCEQDTVLLNGNEVTIAIERQNGLKFVLPVARLLEYGVVDGKDGSCSFETLTPTWAKQIFDWLRDRTASGFEAFFPTASFTGLQRAETDIFQYIRFSITPAEIDEMNQAKAIIQQSVRISGL